MSKKKTKKSTKKQKKQKKTIKDWLKFVALLIGVSIVSFLVFLFFVWLLFGRSKLTDPEDILWGVTFSPLATEDLGLDTDETYQQIIEDLQPNQIRLVAYWNRIEKHIGEFDFTYLDKQVEVAEENGVPYIISVGRRVPRYPECHEPEWSLELPERRQDRRILNFIEKTMERYDDGQNLIAWQVENEPFLENFGECPTLNEDLLNKEIELARGLTDKRIMTTESGELSFWVKASKYPDLLGTTLYRTVIVSGTDIAVNHIFPSWYYRARSNVAKILHRNLDEIIVAELQGEPWTTKGITKSTQAELDRTMSKEQFEENIKFTENVGFPEVYWWGVEWWYWEKQRGNDFYWERARQLFE